MLTITVPGIEYFDEDSGMFFTKDEENFDLVLEHSLATLSKWEAIYEKPFLGEAEKTDEEVFHYIQLMIQTPNVPPEVIGRITEKNMDEINDYINSKQSGTTFNEPKNQRKSRETISAELIYYWMTFYHIPFECENWHLNRLLTLIRVCNVKSAPAKKMSRREMVAQTRALNAQRREQLGTRG